MYIVTIYNTHTGKTSTYSNYHRNAINDYIEETVGEDDIWFINDTENINERNVWL